MAGVAEDMSFNDILKQARVRRFFFLFLFFHGAKMCPFAAETGDGEQRDAEYSHSANDKRGQQQFMISLSKKSVVSRHIGFRNFVSVE